MAQQSAIEALLAAPKLGSIDPEQLDPKAQWQADATEPIVPYQEDIFFDHRSCFLLGKLKGYEH